MQVGLMDEAALERSEEETRVLLLAPTGKDAVLSQRILQEAGLSSLIVADLTGLLAACEEGAVVVAEEALSGSDLGEVTHVLERQAAWSDLPFAILMQGAAASPSAPHFLDTLGNAVLLERPVRISTLLSAVHTALRARDRQYQLRAARGRLWGAGNLFLLGLTRFARAASLHRRLQRGLARGLRRGASRRGQGLSRAHPREL